MFKKRNELLNKIDLPNIQEDLDVKDARKKLSELENQLERVRRESEGSQTINAHSVPDEALRLLDGDVKVDELGKEPPVDMKAILDRQKAVLLKAIEIQRQRVRDVEIQTAQRVCDQIEPALREVIAEHLGTFERVVASIKRIDELFGQLDQCGIGRDARPAHWVITPFEVSLMKGGVNIQSLNHFIRERRSFWQIEGGD